MAKITKDNIAELVLDGYKARGYKTSKGRYGEKWTIEKDGTKVSFFINVDTSGESYCTIAEHKSSKIKMPKTLMKHLDSKLEIQENKIQATRAKEEAQKTTTKLLAAMGFERSEYSSTSYDDYTSVSISIFNFKEECKDNFRWGQSKNKVNLRLNTDGTSTYNIQISCLDMELLETIKTKIESIQDAWEISIL